MTRRLQAMRSQGVAPLSSAIAVISLLTIGCFIYSRTGGFPHMADHIGDGGDPWRVASLASEGLILAASAAVLSSRRPVRTRKTAVVLSCTGLLLLGLTATASADMMQIGLPGPYPDMMAASKADRAAVRHLYRRTWAASRRFDTVAKARRLGYTFNATASKVIGRPGIWHMRRHGAAIWGDLLDPRTPQALVWWCPRMGSCTLVAAMYRWPSTSRPPTYGGLLAWHRHQGAGGWGDWMAHVWFTYGLRSSLARCVPFPELASRGVVYSPYRGGIMIDKPCSASPPSMGDGMAMP